MSPAFRVWRSLLLGRSLLLPCASTQLPRRRLRVGRKYFGTLLLAFFWCASITCDAATPSRAAPRWLLHPPLLIVALPGVTWDEFRAEETYTARTTSLNAVALLSVAPRAQTDSGRIWVTLGAGRTTIAGELLGNARPEGGFQVDIARIVSANQQAHTGARPGLLGTELHKQGLTTALLAVTSVPPGNAPIPITTPLLMDENGVVDSGAIVSPAQLAQALDDALTHHEVVLFDLTEVAAPDHPVTLASQAAYRHSFRLCLIGTPATREQGRRMGWIALRKLSPNEPSLLTSASTRWAGVVSPTDFAATLLAEMDEWGKISRQEVTGRLMVATPTERAHEHLNSLDRRLTAQSALVDIAGHGYAAYMAVLVLTAALVCWRVPARLHLVTFPALVAILIPSALLVAPLTGLIGIPQLVAGVLMALSGAYWVCRIQPPARGLLLALLGTTLVVCADALTGWHLHRLSPLGTGAASGFRFYGIGNESAGVLCASTCLSLGLLLDAPGRRPWIVLLPGAIIAFILGAPWWGANWGGYMALVAGLLAFGVLSVPQVQVWRLLAAACALIALSVMPGALDLLRPEAARSHLGAAASALSQGHLPSLTETALRKLVMNWRLVQVAGAWWILTPFVLLALRPLHRRWQQTSANARPSTSTGVFSAVIAAVIGLLVNDSGIVLFGMTMAIIVSSVIFLMSTQEAVEV